MNAPKLLSICLAVLALLASCSTDSSPPGPPDSTRSGSSRLLALSGTVLRLGSPDVSPSSEERSGWTRLGHDVWLDTTEVTQSEFASLLGRNPSTIRGDRLPVTNVSWYDAVLAANARSRRDGLDSVYEYVSVRSDSSGNAGDLSGLTIHLDRSGWRLPTESEWEAAARAGTTTPWPWGDLSDSSQADSHAWYQKNASGRLHEVATKRPNAWGLHDMAGNVMEWVNDWKGAFPQDTMSEFAGQDVPGDVPDVPLKGGAYVYGLSHLRPSTRSATYAAYRSSRAEYVGFRLARGAFSPRYRSSTGAEVYTPPVTLVRSDLARLVGAWEARLVFVNRANGKGTLTWIDYGESNPLARSLPDSLPVFHPAISPDGQWVVWSTALEGSTGPSRIRARRLARNDTVVDLGEGSIPRWWVSGTDTFLVRASALDNTAPGWSATNTTARRWSGGSLAGPEETWSGSGSYHDGRSGPYLVTGYRRLRQYDTRTGRERILFTGPGNGKGAGDTSQVCNASASPDGTGRVLFLDFGYDGNSTVVGRPYGIHEVGFVSDSTGRIVGQIPAPIGERQWEHLEWSNSQRWAVSGSIDATGAYRNLYLVDLDSAKATKIVSGQELWQPALWAGASTPPVFPGDADPDSAGAWNDPATDLGQQEAAAKFRAFWFQAESMGVIAVGSSRVKSAIVPSEFSMRVFNAGYSGAEVIGDRRFLEDYVLPHAPRLKAVILSLMPGWMFTWRGGLSWHKIGNSVGYRYDRNHEFWRRGVPSGYLERIRSRRWLASGDFDTLGSAIIPSTGWGGSPIALSPPAAETIDGEPFQSNWADLLAIGEACRSRGIHLVLVNYPQSPAYAGTSHMGRYGPTWSTWRELSRRLRLWEASSPYFHFYDAHNEGRHDYGDSMAADYDHLSTIGGIRFSRRLDSLLVSHGVDAR